MLADEILIFLVFFKRLDKDINSQFQNKRDIDWNPIGDINMMYRSGLSQKIFADEMDFFNYMRVLSNDKYVDYYPTFLKIMELLDLKNLDKALERIFLGKPDYRCHN